MAKGNMFIGNGSGKVGNLVVATRAGEQITRVYQPRVANPKSYQQMLQRAKFANAVKFYKKAVQNFFKFAFEDKKKSESDYNAFMRHNIMNSALLIKGNVDDAYFPALGRWVMSSGSLPNAFSIENAEASGFAFDSEGIKENATIGDISSALIGQGFHTGDIVTFVLITSPVTYLDFDLTNLYDSGLKQPEWLIVQFAIDPRDTRDISQANYLGSRYGGISGFEGNSLFVNESGIIQWDGNFDNEMAATCCIVTRNTGNGVMATNTSLFGNPNFNNMISEAEGTNYENEVLVSWGARAGAILKGSIATRSGAESVVGLKVNGERPPFTQEATEGDVTYTITSEKGDLKNVSPGNVPAGITVKSHTLSEDKKTYTLILTYPTKYPEGMITYMGKNIIRVKKTQSSDDTDA
jgi:hypothetical protein